MQFGSSSSSSFLRNIVSAASLVVALIGANTAHAQPVITLSDLFTQTNLYYRAYANKFDPTDTTGSTAYTVPADVIGGAGPDQLWDFSGGPTRPTNEVLRFDYLSPVGLAQATDFPDATLVEQETVEGSNSQPQWLFYTPVPGIGRRVYGYYAENSFFTPSNVFTPPIVDFPDPMKFGDTWDTATEYQNTLNLDGGTDGTSSAGQKVDVASHFTADAYGTLIPPDTLGVPFAQVLRVTEEVTYDFSVDFGSGQFDHVETDYARNYYWFMPGYGMVAQLNSTQGSTPVSTNFTRAVAFVRMFETNKKPTTGGGGPTCTAPNPVNDMKIRVSQGVILLSWSKADCATKYVVQFTTTPADSSSWTDLGTAIPGTIWQGENTQKGPARFYRVVSMK